MLYLSILVACLAATNAMVCFKGICDDIKKPDALQCSGGIIKNGGFCGCSDVCAKQEGEECTAEGLRGRPPIGTCDKGLKCVHKTNMVIGAGKCVKVTQREADTRTLCQQRRTAAMISMVVYRGQWFPKCDVKGLFQAQQCDNIGQCFCVDVHTGVVDQSTKVLGSAIC